MASAEKASKYLSLVQDEFRKHSDGSVCKAQSPETCPFNKRAESGDRLEGDAGSGITAADDAAYLDAVKRGDMETAEQMVREAAAKAMPDAFVKGSVLHVTDSDFTVFDDSKFGTGIGGGVLGRGFYFSTDGENLPDDGEHTREYFVNVQNPFVFQPEYKPQMKAVLKAIGDYTGKKFDVKNALDDIDAILNHKGAMAYDVADYLTLKFGNDERRDNQTSFRDFLKSFGYDGVYSDSLGELVAFYPSQIKSADPVTYDDAGNVIPLSKRFNFSSADIRDEATGRILDIIKNVDAEDASLDWTSGKNPEIHRYRGKRQPIDRVPKKITKQIIVENCKLIKTVDEKLLPLLAGKVYGMLTGKVEAEDFIDWCMDECGLEEWQAYRIARDQIVKAREWIKIADWKHRGVSYVMWCHSGKDAEPRDYHVAKWNGKSGLRNGCPNGLNGFVFNIDNPPVIDKKTGERGLPSTLIGCKCFLRGIKGV